MINEWNGLASLLANLIEKYALELNLDQLPYPEDNNTTKNNNNSVVEEVTVS